MSISGPGAVVCLSFSMMIGATGITVLDDKTKPVSVSQEFAHCTLNKNSNSTTMSVYENGEEVSTSPELTKLDNGVLFAYTKNTILRGQKQFIEVTEQGEFCIVDEGRREKRYQLKSTPL